MEIQTTSDKSSIYKTLYGGQVWSAFARYPPPFAWFPPNFWQTSFLSRVSPFRKLQIIFLVLAWKPTGILRPPSCCRLYCIKADRFIALEVELRQTISPIKELRWWLCANVVGSNELSWLSFAYVFVNNTFGTLQRLPPPHKQFPCIGKGNFNVEIAEEESANLVCRA